MDFYAVLAQVMALLQREGRTSYRALKRQFALDDDYIADLKEELIAARRLAVDEDGRVLVWTGGAETLSAAPSSAVPQEPQPPPPEAAFLQTALPPVTPSTAAERRQLTVMFCALADSTTLSGQLDPEEYREVVRAYQSTCTEVIQRFDGHVAQLLGDGLLVYFGYPQAHEDDPHRAVRTGLGILTAMGDLNTALKRDKGVQVAGRLGIHTGVVVFGARGGGCRQWQAGGTRRRRNSQRRGENSRTRSTEYAGDQ